MAHLINKIDDNEITNLSVNDFSQHLFWDVNRDKLSLAQNKRFIVQRVLEYGVLKDWQVLKKQLGVKKIAAEALNLHHLDNKALSFISLIAKIPKEDFSCFTTKQSTPKHWDF